MSIRALRLPAADLAVLQAGQPLVLRRPLRPQPAAEADPPRPECVNQRETMNKTPIQWTDYSSNPIRAYDSDTGKRGWFCTHASPGCENCYSEALNRRLGNGLAYIAQNRQRVRFEVDEREFKAWQRLKPGERVFVCDMTDLFHEDIPDETIDRVFDAMAASRGTFQVLTKRAARLPGYFERWALPLSEYPDIWVGVSVEDQRRADERIPHLLKVPAAVRFLSVEPLLEPVDLGLQSATCNCCAHWPSRWVQVKRKVTPDFPMSLFPENQGVAVARGIHRAESNRHGALSIPVGSGSLGIKPDEFEALPALDWVIVGGESGRLARPCNVAWVRSVVSQCRAAGVPCFVKQLGKWVAGDDAGFRVQKWLLDDLNTVWVPPVIGPRARERPLNAAAFGLGDPKGGDWLEWPADLRVREMPGELEAAGQRRLF